MIVTPIDPVAQGAEGDTAVPPSSFLQTPFWANFKASHGWSPLFFTVSPQGDQQPAFRPFFLTVLVRPLFRVASIAYVPLGPDVSEPTEGTRERFLDDLARALRPYVPANTLFIRFDPPWGTTVDNAASGEDAQGDAIANPKASAEVFPIPLNKPATSAPSNVQPPDTVILDLTKEEDTLLSEMKPKWRYNIRLGEKKGVTIRFLEGERGAAEGIDLFYELYLETANRDGIAIHSREYYRDLVRRVAGHSPFDKPVSVRVYLAEHEGTTLASIITIFCGTEAVYLYGASSNEKRNLMPAYSLQWRAIRDAKAQGCERYDFYGIPPRDDPTHPMYGLYRFKTGFGGSIVHRVGSWDIPLRTFLYGAYGFAEATRAFWFKKVRKLFKR
jgi:lipid II:glycine glycyltransferase (peptidoglycan interpeptide bridge formation enzyme)